MSVQAKMAKFEPYLVLEGHEERVWHVSWSPDGNFIASASEDKTVRIWAVNTSTPSCIVTLDDTAQRTIRCVEWSHDGTMLAAASFDGTAMIWKKNPYRNEWIRMTTLEGHENEVKSVAFSHDDTYIATGTATSYMRWMSA